jgi:hypothetical protein
MQESTTLHELQHAIQQREGFARGGNPSQFTGDFANVDAAELGQKFDDAAKLRRMSGSDYDLDRGLKRFEMLIGRKPSQDVIDMSGKMDADWLQKRANIYKAGDEEQAYRRLAGEAEARNVQTRLDWTPEQRRATPPWETLDVPEDELIYRKDLGGLGSQMSVDLPENPLYKVMNMQAEAIPKIDELGGLPVPSVVVAGLNQGFDSFGDISLVGTRGAFERDPTFASDVYSPRFPRSIDDINAKALRNEEALLSQALPNELTDRLSSDFQPERISEDITRLSESPANKAYYLQGIGENIDPAKYTSMPEKPNRTMPSYFDSYYGNNAKPINRATIYNSADFEQQATQWLNESGVGDASPEFYDSNGKINNDGKMFVAKIVRNEKNKFKDYDRGPVFDRFKMTDDINKKISENKDGFANYIKEQSGNAVKLMKGNIRGGEGYNYGVGSIRSQVAPQLKSVSQIMDNRGKIVSDGDMTAIKEGFDSRFDNLYDELSGNWAWDSSPSYGDFAEGLQAAAKGDMADFKNLSPSQKAEMQGFFDELANAPTNYFEIKPQRAVDIDEFYGAAVPEGTPESVIKSLQDKGLEVEFYKPEQRADAVKRLNKKSGGNILFSGGGVAVLYGQGSGEE